MKKNIIYIIGIVSALFTSCENISESKRLIEIEGVTAQRVVLLEDYTGQACVNCPEAHRTASELHEQYPNNLIVVSMHAGGFGMPAPAGLMQPEGNEYADRAGVEDYPSGVVNRRGGAKLPEFWATSVREEIQKPSVVQFDEFRAACSEVITDNGREYNVDVHVIATALEQIDDAKLQLWVLEDSIVKVQRLPDGKADFNYVHNHVYRASVNGVWGESVTLRLGEPVPFRRNCKKVDDWVAKNLSVVAFIYNDSGVLQAAQCKLDLEPTDNEVDEDNPIND